MLPLLEIIGDEVEHAFELRGIVGLIRRKPEQRSGVFRKTAFV